MVKPAFPLSIPIPLSRSISLVTSNLIGSVYSVGIDGVGYILSTLDQESPFEFRSYEVQSIPPQKPRIDDQNEPGEQTLAAWWARAQHAWFEGAGQHVFDSPFSSRFRFCNSKGINIWHEKQDRIQLLKDTAAVRSDDVDDHHLVSTDVALIYTHDGNIVKHADPDTGGGTTLATHDGVPINSLAYDGESVYAAFSGGSLGIKKVVVSSFAAWVDISAHTAVELIAFVKGRLIGAKANGLFEYDLSITTAPEPFHRDLAATWKWTGITDSGPAVYFSGFAGDRSEIFAARLTAQDIPFASQATLGALRSVWQAPEGEVIHTIKGYIGQQVLIGTSKGVRVASIVTGEGDLSVSALIVGPGEEGTNNPVLCFEPQEQWAWFGWSKYDTVSTGLGRVHLGNFAYASDLLFSGQGIIKEVVSYGGRRYFVTDEGTTSRIIKEHATNLVENGELHVCQVGFGTTERKVIRYFDVLSTGPGKWSLEVALDNGAYSIYAAEIVAGGFHQEIITLEATTFGLHIFLHRDAVDPTLGPDVFNWRLRAEPRATGRFRYLVPVMVYDFVELLNGVDEGFTGNALTRLNHLKSIFDTDRDVQFQPLESAVPGAVSSVEVKLEDLRFKSYTPSAPGGSGFGGIALLVLREVR
jgi:hypothetical protein